MISKQNGCSKPEIAIAPVRFQVLTSIKMAAFWDMTPYSLGRSPWW